MEPTPKASELNVSTEEAIEMVMDELGLSREAAKLLMDQEIKAGKLPMFEVLDDGFVRRCWSLEGDEL